MNSSSNSSAALSLASIDRALMAACRDAALATGENSCALYSARKAGYATVAEHRAARAAVEAKAAEERSIARAVARTMTMRARDAAAATYVVALGGAAHRDDGGPVILCATAAHLARRAELRQTDPTHPGAGDTFYVRGSNGRVERA